MCPNCTKNKGIKSSPYVLAQEDLVEKAIEEFEGYNIEDQLEEFNHGFEVFLSKPEYSELTNKERRRLINELENIME